MKAHSTRICPWRCLFGPSSNFYKLTLSSNLNSGILYKTLQSYNAIYSWNWLKDTSFGKNPSSLVHHRPHPVCSSLGSYLAHRTCPVFLKQVHSTSGHYMPSSFTPALSPTLMLKHCQISEGVWADLHTFVSLHMLTCSPLC